MSEKRAGEYDNMLSARFRVKIAEHDCILVKQEIEVEEYSVIIDAMFKTKVRGEWIENIQQSICQN